MPDRLTVSDIARRLGIAPVTWRAWVSRDKAPKADGHYDLRTPWWWSTTVDHWNDSRPMNRRVS